MPQNTIHEHQYERLMAGVSLMGGQVGHGHPNDFRLNEKELIILALDHIFLRGFIQSLDRNPPYA